MISPCMSCLRILATLLLFLQFGDVASVYADSPSAIPQSTLSMLPPVLAPVAPLTLAMPVMVVVMPARCLTRLPSTRWAELPVLHNSKVSVLLCPRAQS